MPSCRHVPSVAALVAAAALALPLSAAAAQSPPPPIPLDVRWTVDAGGARLRQTDGVHGDAGVLAGELRVAGRRTLVTSTVVLAQGFGRTTTAPAEALAAPTTPYASGTGSSAQLLLAASRFGVPVGRLRWEAGVAGYALAMDRATRVGGLLTAREHLALPGGGAWLGASGGALRRDSTLVVPAWSAEAGAWRERGAWRLTSVVTAVATRVPLDFVPVVEPGAAQPPRSVHASYADALLVAGWRRRAMELEVAAGGRSLLDASSLRAVGVPQSGEPVAYGRRVAGQLTGSATWWATPQLAVNATLGNQLTDPLRGSLAARFAMVSVRIAHPPRRAPAAARARTPDDDAAPHTSVTPTDGGGWLVVRAPRAARVEVMGSFTDWEPLALSRTADGWTLATPLASGVHRLTVRVDGGAWRVPANLPMVSDDFGGTVGLLTVP